MEPTKAKGKRPRPAYKALWQAEKKRADALHDFFNPPRFETAPVTQGITLPVMVDSPEDTEEARTAHQLQAVTKDRRDWRVVAIVEALVIAALLLFAR